MTYCFLSLVDFPYIPYTFFVINRIIFVHSKHYVLCITDIFITANFLPSSLSNAYSRDCVCIEVNIATDNLLQIIFYIFSVFLFKYSYYRTIQTRLVIGYVLEKTLIPISHGNTEYVTNPCNYSLCHIYITKILIKTSANIPIISPNSKFIPIFRGYGIYSVYNKFPSAVCPAASTLKVMGRLPVKNLILVCPLASSCRSGFQ